MRSAVVTCFDTRNAYYTHLVKSSLNFITYESWTTVLHYISFVSDILAQEDAYEKFFRDADVDDSGYLTMDELITALRKGGYKGTDAQIRVN